MDRFLVPGVCVSAASLEAPLVPRDERAHAKRSACLMRQTVAEKVVCSGLSP